MNRSFALLEAAVSCGSPTCGSEFAYDALMRSGLREVFSDAALYPMVKLPRCESYPSHLKFYDTVMAVSRTLRENMLNALQEKHFPVIIGGDHSIAMGSLAALGETYGAENVALVYIDAHADINTEQSSVSHFIHGMDLAAACGICCDALQVGKNRVNILGSNIHIFGVRSIDPPEYEIMQRLGVHYHTPQEIRAYGLSALLSQTLPLLEGKRLHISFDVDSLDPSVFSATGYRIPDGLSLAEAQELLRTLVPLCSSFECVEYNPTMDANGKDGKTLMQLLQFVRNLL